MPAGLMYRHLNLQLQEHPRNQPMPELGLLLHTAAVAEAPTLRKPSFQPPELGPHLMHCAQGWVVRHLQVHKCIVS